jgi:hypothetical protein
MPGTYKVYVSYVIQRAAGHIHAAELIDLPLPKYSFYLDNSALQVVKWAEAKQSSLGEHEQIVILNFFNVANIK